MISGFGQERKLSEYVHHYEPLTYDASGVHGQHHRHKRSLPEEDHKVSLKKVYRYICNIPSQRFGDSSKELDSTKLDFLEPT